MATRESPLRSLTANPAGLPLCVQDSFRKNVNEADKKGTSKVHCWRVHIIFYIVMCSILYLLYIDRVGLFTTWRGVFQNLNHIIFMWQVIWPTSFWSRGMFPVKDSLCFSDILGWCIFCYSHSPKHTHIFWKIIFAGINENTLGQRRKY